MSVLPRTLAFLRPYRRWVAGSVILGMVTILSSVALLVASAWIISRAAQRPSIAVLGLAVVSVRFFGIARGVFRYLERLVSHETTFRLLANLRVWFYQKLAPLAPARLVGFRSGDLLARAVNNIETLQEFYVRAVAPPLVALLVTVAMFLFMAAFDLRLAIVLTAFMAAASIGVTLLVQRLSRQHSQAAIMHRANLNANVVDTVQGMSDVVAFNSEQRQTRQLETEWRELSRYGRHMGTIHALQTALGGFLVNLAAISVLIIAAPSQDGLLLAALVLGAIAAFEAVLPIPTAGAHLATQMSAAKSLYEVADAESTVAAPANPLPMPQSNILRVDGLSFRYSAHDSLAIDDISFELPEGGTLAIVGPSGSGKSTLVNLLLRFWDYETGVISLGGIDTRKLAPEELRARIGVVTQNTYLFNTTIRENLLLARRSATEQELIQAARYAQIHDFISGLPDGYETRVGELGLNLSGGECQRLAIARAFLKNAPILILDEATANLDAVTERDIMQAVNTLMQGRTTLIITHRLIGLEAADEIVVLQQGKITERGSHASLMDRQGSYYQLYSAQRAYIG